MSGWISGGGNFDIERGGSGVESRPQMFGNAAIFGEEGEEGEEGKLGFRRERRGAGTAFTDFREQLAGGVLVRVRVCVCARRAHASKNTQQQANTRSSVGVESFSPLFLISPFSRFTVHTIHTRRSRCFPQFQFQLL